MTK
ncbi:hypothetical protein YPPY08_1810, partial [Yersinia pestis PY-08]|jgi:pyridoxine 4-dehydrogenase